MTKDLVNHPEHYNHEGRKECWDEFIDKYGAKNTFVWCLLTAQKYMYRMGTKDNNPAEQDLDKALAYLHKATRMKYEYRELDGYNNGLYHKTYKELKKHGKV